MGYQMAKRLAIKPLQPAGGAKTPSDDSEGSHPIGARLHRGSSMHRGMQENVMRRVLVWNRTGSTATQHAEEFHSVDISAEPFGPQTVGQASILFLCLPTSDITFEKVKVIAPHLRPEAIVVDCCTGHPNISRQISAWLQQERPGIRYMDCPISGGPGGASKGTLAAMLGGDLEAARVVWPHIEAFAANIVHLGPVGAGHAVKAINNACNVSNLLCLHEGLLALKKMGVNPAAALEVINKSSGRSLMSQARVPEEVLTREFNYGFKLGLMAKDVSIATDLMDEYYPGATIYRRTLKVHYDAMAQGTVNFDSDYTEIVKHQELQAKAQLKDEVKTEEAGPAPDSQAADVDALRKENEALRRRLAELEAAQK
eukprot:TRINITY_DN19740_c0_g2_i1.p1 TRINITY_DN19740_c0_g2~~TRINITY_DN19740_c0_g2_i1.p1  ORF type:complete len:431 (+),score=75.04 TRINITY_DN19740_c0_g2_i1:186-1295(+)